jgi:hypothetical protein
MCVDVLTISPKGLSEPRRKILIVRQHAEPQVCRHHEDRCRVHVRKVGAQHVSEADIQHLPRAVQLMTSELETRQGNVYGASEHAMLVHDHDKLQSDAPASEHVRK